VLSVGSQARRGKELFEEMTVDSDIVNRVVIYDWQRKCQAARLHLERELGAYQLTGHQRSQIISQSLLLWWMVYSQWN
jgi:hypothetical protein